MVSRSSLPPQPPRTAGQQLRRRLRGPLPALLLLPLLAAGCQGLPNPESRRIDQLELKIQQLEQRLNKADLRPDTADPAGKPPAGVVKSLTLRTDTEDDRLRIYWADGSRTDLPCTKEQTTLVCG
ncbi:MULTISPECIES: hypothetical protein [Cyanophyceae]|uniref:Lipoprotein n=1 Tax=Aphanothece cf. minutissima CCALA 015 TaxID=2107695 RepID=A0ABX5F5Y8_9CHRO|nr:MULTISPECIES: hypothetical protein [Cyanophyceae]MCP9935098.1 hypothetical protein [Cyanobium sp. Candia 9D4]PSB36165.1 hypothetical protein C7B81_14300 [Aphanothece cf. minutissima CCALA 015]